MKKTTTKRAKAKCGHGPISLIVMTLGLYLLIAGLKLQLASSVAWDWAVMLYYLVGLILVAVAKMQMCGGHGTCSCN